MLVERTERGDEMFMAMLRRHSQHVLDTEALAIAARTGCCPNRCSRSADDEGAHHAGDEPLWSESWYVDFVDAEQGVGGWVRLGLIPNENSAWINALLCGPGMPTIALNDFEAQLPTTRPSCAPMPSTSPTRRRTAADLPRQRARARSGVRRSGRAVAR